MKTIFVSYRREDSSGFAGRLCDQLIGEFGKDRVFRDVDSLRGAQNFEIALNDRLHSCAVMLVVIGRTWAQCLDAEGKPRLQDPADWVRREVEEGLRRGVSVMPVLVDGTSLPTAKVLPSTLHPLLKRQTVDLRDGRSWNSDVTLLVKDLREILGETGSTQVGSGRWRNILIAVALSLVIGGGLLSYLFVHEPDNKKRTSSTAADPMFDVLLDEYETCFHYDVDANVTQAEFSFRLKPLISDQSRVIHAFLGIIKVFDADAVPEGAALGTLTCRAPACLGSRLSDDLRRPTVLRGGTDGTLVRLHATLPGSVRRVLAYARYYQLEGAGGSRCQIDSRKHYDAGEQLPYLVRVDDRGRIVGEACDGAEDSRTIPIERRLTRYCLRE